MAKISSFMICDTVNNLLTPQGESIPQLVSPQPALRPPFIPGSFSFGLSIGVTGVVFQDQNVFRMIIRTPNGEEIHNSGDINFGTVPEDDQLPLDYQGFIVSTDIRNLIIRESGVYSLEVIINNESIGTKEIPIFRREENK